MKDRSDDPSHHERMLLPQSDISLVKFYRILDMEVEAYRSFFERLVVVELLQSASGLGQSCSVWGVPARLAPLPHHPLAQVFGEQVVAELHPEVVLPRRVVP